MWVDQVPADLLAAIDARPRAQRTFRTLDRQNLFALAFRTSAMKTAGRRPRADDRDLCRAARAR